MKKLLITSVIIMLVFVIVISIPFIVLACRTNSINNDFCDIYNAEKYQHAVILDGIKVVEQKVSCGYAVMEMFAKYVGDDLTEQALLDQYGKVVTSTGKSFENEMNKQFSNYRTTMHKYMKNTELIDKIYKSLNVGMPVPIEWAAKYDNDWTLHYSLVIGIDIPNDLITIANPYGYNEELSIKEFIYRTTFNAYENIPALFKFGFAFGAFEKNTVFIIEKI